MFFRRQPEEVRAKERYLYIDTHRDRYTVKEMCSVLKLSESGYYRSIRNKGKQKKSDLLLVEIEKIRKEHPDNDNYGAPRILIALEQRGIKTSYSTVFRVMKEAGILQKKRRRSQGITKADEEAQMSENLIQRDFSASEPNEKWLTDITEIKCLNGKLYLAAVLDCWNGEIVGYAMADNMRKELCIEAFKAACRRTGAREMILHSDRGSQFTSAGFRETLKEYGATQSMSSTGRCYDNARMESFFATLKKEKLYKIKSEQYSRSQIMSVIFRYIEAYYNRQRIYTANPGGWPPKVLREWLFRSVA